MTHNNTSNTELEAWLDENLKPCPDCNGDGYTAEHDPSDPHENGCSHCPVQVQCERCHANGYFVDRQVLLAKFEERERLARERWHKEWIELLTWATKQENVTFVDLARKMNSKLLQTKLTTDTSQLSTNKESEKEA